MFDAGNLYKAEQKSENTVFTIIDFSSISTLPAIAKTPSSKNTTKHGFTSGLQKST